VSDFGSRQEALQHLRVADNRWTEAVRTFRPYPERLRRLADAADAADDQRRAFLYAEVCNVKWQPRENAKNLSLAPDLEAPNREGPPDLWAKFDKAQKRFGDALAGDSLMAIAQAFGDITQAITAIADALDLSDAAASQAS
jgi:hypothetical protein